MFLIKRYANILFLFIAMVLAGLLFIAEYLAILERVGFLMIEKKFMEIIDYYRIVCHWNIVIPCTKKNPQRHVFAVYSGNGDYGPAERRWHSGWPTNLGIIK
jgi:hypothetical protein